MYCIYFIGYISLEDLQFFPLKSLKNRYFPQYIKEGLLSEVDFTVFGLLVNVINKLSGSEVVYGNSEGDFIIEIRAKG